MKMKFGRRKITFRTILSLLILFFTSLNLIYTWIEPEIKDSYYATSSDTIPNSSKKVPFKTAEISFKTTEKKLNSLELLFADLPNDDNSTVDVKIYHNDKNIYGGIVPVSSLIKANGWFKLPVNLGIGKGAYKIKISSKNCSTRPSLYVSKDYAVSETTKNKINGKVSKDKILLRYGYLLKPTKKDKVAKSVMIVLISSLLLFILQKFEYIKELLKRLYGSSQITWTLRKVVLAAVQILMCFILVNDASIEFQIPMKAVLYVVSVLPSFFLDKIFFRLNDDSKEKTTGILISAFLGGFAFTGNRMLIYPLDMKTSFLQIIIFVISVLWFIPISSLSLYGLEYVEIFKHKRLSTFKFIVICSVLLILPACYGIYAFNPAISSPDTVYCMDAAHHLHGMVNWHPPFYCMLLKLILKVWDSPYAVVGAQFIFWVYVLLEVLLFCRKRGIDDAVLILVSFLLGINPGNYIHLCTIWKDVPYAITTLWLTVIIAKLILEKQTSIYTYIEFVIASVFTFFIRQNGIVPCILCLGVLFIVMRRNKKMVLSIITSVILIVIVRGPIYSCLNVQDSDGGMYIGLSQDILGVYYVGGDVSEDTMKMIDVLTKNNAGQYAYDPYWSNASYSLDVSMGKFITNYLDTFIKNPGTMIREIICRQDCVWDLFGGQNATLGCVNNTSTMDGDSIWTSYYQPRHNNAETFDMTRFDALFTSSQLLNTLSWKSGIYTLLTVVSFVYCVHTKKKHLWIIFLPFAGQVLSLILSTGWSDFRYYWPLNLMTVFIVLISATVGKQKDNNFNC